MKSEIRSVKWYEFSKFKKSVIRNLRDDPQISDSNFLILFLLFLWARIKVENYFYIKDGEIAGILSLGTNRGNQVFIYAIAVEPTFRKQGIGKALMNFSEERAAELNKEYLALVVMQNNKPAISLYQKYGYRIVGEGKTYLSINSDKIKTNSTSSLELRKSNLNDNDLLSILRQFILGEINTLSGKEGLEYFEEFRFQEYYQEIKKATQKGKQFLYSIYRDDILVGFLLFSDKKHMRNISVYSQVDTWNIDFLNNISYALNNLQSSNGKIITFKFRLSTYKTEKIENLNQSDFQNDVSKNKLLMFKKL